MKILRMRSYEREQTALKVAMCFEIDLLEGGVLVRGVRRWKGGGGGGGG
jgi:hypothetical protein